MKKAKSILRFGEISVVDLFRYLLKNIWVALLIAVAAALTAYSVIGPAYPDEYSSSLTVLLRSTSGSSSWNSQFGTSRTAALKLNKAINDKTINTDFASESLNRKINATVTSVMVGSADQKSAVTNLLTITATAQTQEEVYLYLMSMGQNLDRLSSRAGLKNVSIEAVNEPVMPSSATNDSSVYLLSLIIAVVAGVLSCAVIVGLRLFERPLATRKAAERLCVLPIAGALNKGGRGKGVDGCLPIPASERADGQYVKNLAEAASFLLAQKASRLQVVPLESKSERKEEIDRLALDLALAMAEEGAQVCFVDPTGAALSALSVEKDNGTTFYHIKGNKLTICTSGVERALSENFDKVVYASVEPDAKEETHTLWAFRAGCHTVDEINAVTAPGGGTPTSASLLCYGLHAIADTAAYTNEKAIDKMNALAFDNDSEVDVLRWAAAAIKVMGRMKYKWMVSFAIVTVAALAAGLMLQRPTYRMNTVFAVATDDVTRLLSSEQLAQMNVEDAVELMDQGSEEFVYGNALYPSSLFNDRNTLMDTLPAVLNGQLTNDAMRRYLGGRMPAESVSISERSDDESFMLSVVGSDKDKLAQVTEAFFAVAPSVSAHAAGGLTYFAGESSTSEDRPSIAPILILAWVLVIGVGFVYALIVGFRDRTALLRYEAEEALSTRVIDKLSRGHGKKAVTSATDALSADVGLAGFIYEWAEKEKKGAVLMITSAMREEGSAELTRTVEALLKQNGKRAAIADRATCEKLLTEGREALAELLQTHDFILIDRPGMAVDGDAQLLAKQADALLWAVRVGYADKERLEAAASVCPNEKVLGCVRMIG